MTLSPALPTPFGKYFLTEKLATGGMAEVYIGKLFGPGGFEKQLVIKQIHPDLAEHQHFVDMFVAEAKTAVSLTHANIVAVYELGLVDSTYFIAMEFVDGVTLAELFAAARKARRALGPALSSYVCAEILKGLDYAHRRPGKVVHRDLSSRNVMLSRAGEVKVLDFGLAATVDNVDERGTSGARAETGRPIGSFPYLSPEQVERKSLDARSDLFSCGILLWELLTGTSLFRRDHDDDTLAAILSAPIVAPSTLAPAVPAALDEICLKALERDAHKRWPSASDFLSALAQSLYAQQPMPTATDVAQLVLRLCPDVPRTAVGRGRDSTGRSSQPSPGRTRALPGRERVQTFATHVAFDDLLKPAGSAARRVPDPASHAPSTKPPEAPRRARVWAAGSIAFLLVASVAAGLRWFSRPSPATAPDGRPVVFLPSPSDAARPSPPADAAGSDAASRPPPAKQGTLVLGSDVRAALWVDGNPIGPVPRREVVAAGTHRVRFVCAPDQCPPAGASYTTHVTVDADKEVSLVHKFHE